VLNKEMVQHMLTPYIDSSIALGVFIEKRGGQKYFGHSGSDEGFISRYWGSVDGGNGVVVMSNTDDIPLVNEIINSIAVVYAWKDFYTPFMTLKKISLSDAILASYAGQYQNDSQSDGQYNLTPGSIFTVTKKGHHLRTQVSGQEIIDIYPSTSTMFFPKTSDTDITFKKDEKGIVTKLVIHQNGKLIECKKIR
jgi:hypothetical protein